MARMPPLVGPRENVTVRIGADDSIIIDGLGSDAKGAGCQPWQLLFICHAACTASVGLHIGASYASLAWPGLAVVEADIVACASVIHIVSSVLLPDKIPGGIAEFIPA